MPEISAPYFGELADQVIVAAEREGLAVLHFGDVEWYHREDGYASMLGLLERRRDIDGVFCFNGLLAIGAMRALRESGRAIPTDVAVVGFDDIDECRYAAPPLTSLAPDKRRWPRRRCSCSRDGSAAPRPASRSRSCRRTN